MFRMKLEDFQMLRMKPKAFTFFCSEFLSIVVGVTKWRKERVCKLVCEIATPSDEAFVLHCLENNWERWEAMAVKR